MAADIPLKAHLESSQLNRDDQRAYVKVPGAHDIAVVDLLGQRRVASWRSGEFSSHFPISLDNTRPELWVVFRSPPKLVAFNPNTGVRIAALDSCSDADDLFVNAKRDRIYLSCGAGTIEVWGKRGASYAKLESIPTVAGARTSLLVPHLDRLYLAFRATSTDPAAIWVFRAPSQN